MRDGDRWWCGRILTLLGLASFGGTGCQDEAPTPPLPPPAAITDLFVAASDSMSLLLVWTAPGAHGADGVAARYDLRFALSDSVDWDQMDRWPLARAPKGAGVRESLRVGPLLPETGYLFQLQAVAPDSSRSLPSNRAFGATSTPDRTPPGPIAVSFVRATANSVTVGWTATGDDGDAGQASAYRARYRRIEETSWQLFEPPRAPRPSGSPEELTVTGLAPETAYKIEVSVLDEAENRSSGTARWSCWTGVAEDRHWSAEFGPPPAGSGIEGQVLALASYQGLLVAAGDFTQAGALQVSDLAAWDGRGWRMLGPSGTSGAYPKVTRLLTVGAELFAAGSFAEIGGVAAQNIARWDGASWHALGGGSEGSVGDLTILDGHLVARGWFRVAGDLVANARWNGDAWEEVAPLPAGAMIEAVGGTLYGTGSAIERPEPDSTVWIARLDPDGWRPILLAEMASPLPFVRDEVTDLLSWRGWLCAGGSMHGVPGEKLSAWDGAGWRDLAPPIDMRIFDMEWPMLQVLAEYQGDLVAGGYFIASNAHHSCSLLRTSGHLWRGFGTGIGYRPYPMTVTPLGVVRAACEHEGSLFVGGRFELAGLRPSANIARWDP